MNIYTYQDFENATDIKTFIVGAISAHKASDAYTMAVTADQYDHQKNVTINEYVKTLYTMGGAEIEDFTASNNRIACNLFNRLNTQRCQYSLGNGISFVQPDEAQDGVDEVKEKLGDKFDRDITEAAYYALIHGVSFPFWNYDDIVVFKLTEFVPLWDEYDGTLRAGIRFWQLADNKPMSVTFYREDGYSEWRQDGNRFLKPLDSNGEFADAEVLQSYKVTRAYVPADNATTIVGEENYGSLPIVPMWASRLKQSTLVGLRAGIDAYDLIRSGFADDLEDCAMVYWIVRNAGGMTDEELSEFRDRVKLQKIANIDSSDGADAQAYTQDIPYQARESCLSDLRNGIYEDFGALDVHAVAAGATNDHIDAAYQPMDENAADFEYWIGEAIIQLLKLAGIDDTPIFQRNRISNQREQVEMVVMESAWLDRATILRKFPNIRPDEVAAILNSMDDEDIERFGVNGTATGGGEPEV